MSVNTCPRCRADLPVAEGSATACPACGPGAEADATPDASAAPAATPATAPAAPSGGRWRVPALVAAVVVVAAAALVAVYSVGDTAPTALSQEEAAGLAMADLAAHARSADGGDLRGLAGTFSFDDDFGAGTLTLDMEWGRDGAGRFAMSIRSGATTVQVDTYCFQDRHVLVYGDEAYESRPRAGDASCMALMMDDAPADEEDLALFQLRDDMRGLQVTPHADGTVTATFSDDDGNYTLLVDAEGRATRLEVSSPDGDGAFDISYGARRTLTAPAASERIPSEVDGSCRLSDGRCEYQAFGGGDAPLSDFQVRLYPTGAGPEDDPDATPAAAFPLDGGDQSADGFSFTLTEDGDGRFGTGDAFVVTAPGDGYEVVVWDLWADRDVQDRPMPGLAPLWAALALAAAALVRRRQ